jgi:hypothetical protein
MERGDLAPVQDKKVLEQWAKQLGLERGSEQWQMFFDLAAIERGRIPDDIRSDEEIVSALPLFFRTLRGQKHSEEEVEKIIGMLRKR